MFSIKLSIFFQQKFFKFRCIVWEKNDENSEENFCGLFGALHLRNFNGDFENCVINGAFTFVDNGFFIIQITTSLKLEEKPTSNKIYAAGRITKVCNFKKKKPNLYRLRYS